MRKPIAALTLLLWCSLSAAQFSVGAGSKPTAVSPSSIMPAGKIYINLATVAKPRYGFTGPRVAISCVDPSCNNVTKPTSLGQIGGTFRISCKFSHAAFDDPIVWPGRPGMTHLHQFFGNTSTRFASDLDNMATAGNSTCAGGTLNRSGYWTPPMVYHRPGNSRDGEVLFGYDNNAYYKSDCCYNTAAIVSAMKWPQPGHRMIAGNATNTGVLNTNIAKFACQGSSSHFFDHIPTTAEATALGAGECPGITMMIIFPQCWDGVNLDSPNHQSHMAPADAYAGCTDPAFPTLFPTISFNVHFRINDLADLDYLRLASDQPKATAAGVCADAAHNYCAGATAHGDWVNGWPESLNWLGFPTPGSITNAILTNCLKPAPNYAHDCHNHLLGNPDPANPNNYYTLQ